ncbi:hypothetical protein [Comamonas sp. NoAH]|uniref:hypothetical protein n=1 Tax=Comamonas halotolerans TaxID=3041496 RepID=UPI0024E09781|nr:hypothetical protein [Comamonas sp. NoAH]
MRRIFSFLTALENSPACSCREEAFQLVKKLWVEANLSMHASQEVLTAIRTLELDEAHGWVDLDRDPCYLPNVQESDVRLYLHNDGTIVIQRMELGVHPILLFKLGCGRPLKKRSAEHLAATTDESI